VTALLEALAEHPSEARAEFRSDFSRAMARFHVPQMMRLMDAFNRIAREIGQDEEWI
jgi:hypothetical protein